MQEGRGMGRADWGRRRRAKFGTGKAGRAPHGGAQRARGVPKFGGGTMRTALLGPCVELPMGPRATRGAGRSTRAECRGTGEEREEEDEEGRTIRGRGRRTGHAGRHCFKTKKNEDPSPHRSVGHGVGADVSGIV